MRPCLVNITLGRLATIVLTCLLTLTGLLAVAPSAVATQDPSELPTILSPTEGETAVGDFSGPITIDFSPVQRASTWTVDAVSHGGCSQPAGTSKCSVSTSVPVDATTGTIDVPLPDPLGRSATYVLRVVESTGGLAAERTFTVTGATDDTNPDPEPQPEPTDLGTITSPANGARVQVGYRGPVLVSFPPTNPTGRYALEVESTWDYDYRTFEAAGGEQKSISISALNNTGHVTLTLSNIDTGRILDTNTITVERPPLPDPTLTVLGVRPSPFYPTVRDGFRDTVTVRYRIDQRASVSYKVFNSDGRQIANNTAGRRSAGANSFTWNGRNNAGDPVTKGRYRIEVTATNNEGGSTTARPVAVVATTDVVTKRGSDYWRGTATDRRSKRGNCFFRGYDGELTLDCWAGNYARAEWDFRVPKTATNVRYRIYGHSNCCDRGSIKGSGKWASRTKITVGLTVTYWRSYTVRRVGITYQYKVRR